MAHKNLISEFINLADQIITVDLERGLKKDLGSVSLYDEFFPRIQLVFDRLGDVKIAGPELDNNSLTNINNALNLLGQALLDISRASPDTFIRNIEHLTRQLNDALESFAQYVPSAVALAQGQLLKSRLGEESNENIEEFRAQLAKKSDEILASVKLEAESILREAKYSASVIQDSARFTASGVALIRSKELFGDLVRNFKIGMTVSGGAAVIGLGLFVGIIIYLFDHPIDIENPGLAIYYTILRVTLLGSIAAVIAFALVVFRSNLHMYYHSLHRQQLTSSIPTFVEAANSDDQRDIIFAKLVEAVSSFGQSGLISKGDEFPNSTKLVVDMLPKILSQNK